MCTLWLLLIIEVGQLRTQPTFVLGPLTLDAQVLPLASHLVEPVGHD